MGKAKEAGIIVGVIFAAFIIAVIVIGALSGEPEVDTKSFAQQLPITTANKETGGGGTSFSPQETTITIVNGVVDVAAGGFVVYPITVPKGANAQLSGSFTTPDGEIRVLIFDEWRFDVWKEKRWTSNLGGVYEGYVDYDGFSGKIQMPGDGPGWIGRGTPIIMVFDNRGDLDNSERIDANITLRYTEYKTD